MVSLHDINSAITRQERNKLNENWLIIKNAFYELQRQINLLAGGTEIDELMNQISDAIERANAAANGVNDALNSLTTLIQNANTATADTINAKNLAIDIIADMQLMIDVFGHKGEYNASVSYSKNNIVTKDGSAYMAVVDNIGQPVTDTNYWRYVAKKGDKGEKGEQGLQGPQGPQGEIGPHGPQGEQGEKGETGAGLNIIGILASESELPTTGNPGDAYTINGDLYVWATSEWENLGNIRGEQGIQGETGPQGPQGVQGVKGDKGENGEGFRIQKTYSSIAEMNADFNGTDVLEGQFVAIASDVNEEENAQVFIKGESSFVFVVDMSGATGIKGEKGEQGDPGVQGPQGPAGASAEVTSQNVTNALGFVPAKNTDLNSLQTAFTSHTEQNASTIKYGHVKIGAGINVEDGVISISEMTATNISTLNGSNVQTELDILKSDTDNKVLSMRDAIVSRGGTVTQSGEVPTASELVSGVNSIPNRLEAGTNYLFSNSTTKTVASRSFVKVKEFTTNLPGSVRVKFNMRAVDADTTIRGQIYINDAPVGILRTSVGTAAQTYIEDFTIQANDKIQLYGMYVSGSNLTFQNTIFEIGVSISGVITIPT